LTEACARQFVTEATDELRLQNFDMENFNRHMASDPTCQGWIHAAICRHWNLGYQPDAILKIINSLPHPLVLLLCRVLDSLSVMTDDSSKTMQKLSEMIGWTTTDKKRTVSIVTEAHFENEKDAGLIKIEYDPIPTGFAHSQKHVEFNTCFARLWCMSKEELLLRFADNDVPLPYSGLDWLRNVIFDLETHFQNDTIRYSRLIFGRGQAARAVLVEITTRKSFNSVGQIIQVFVSPDHHT
jgi:hypothetical protein